MKKQLSVVSSILLFLILTGFTSAKIKVDKTEELLCSKKWTIVKVKKRRNEFEVGETFSFTRDKKFIISSNKYSSVGGTWKIYNGTLILVFNTNKDGENRKIPSEHKIKKLSDKKMILKYDYLEGKGRDKKKVKAKLTLA